MTCTDVNKMFTRDHQKKIMDTGGFSSRCSITTRSLGTVEALQLAAVAQTYRQGEDASLFISKGVTIMFIWEKFWLRVHVALRGLTQ